MIEHFKALSAGSKVLVGAGSLVALFGIFAEASFMASYLNPCADLNANGILQLAIFQAIALVLLVFLLARLGKPRSKAYKMTVGVLIVVLAVAQLFTYIGWGFAVGTVCSNAGA